MKRTFSTIVLAACSCALLFALAGCEMIGIGNSGNGIPQLGTAKVAAPVISEDGTLRVGVDAANAPFSTLVDGKMVGIDVDIAAALAEELGVKVKVVDVGATPEAALEAGTVDIVMGMDSADTAATCWLSDPYLSTAVAIFATSSGAMMPTANSNAVVEAQESSMSAWEITNQFGEESLKAVSDLKTVFDDLESGSAVYGAADAIIGSYVSHTSAGKSQIIGLMQKAGGYCIGVSAANNDLKPIITEAIASLRDKGIIGVVESKWIGSPLNLSAMALTEAAQKGEVDLEDESDDEKKESKLGDVGGNAVALEDDGSQPGEGDDTTGATDGYWGYTYTEPAADTGYTDTGYTDYTDYGDANAETGYTEPDYGDGDAGAGDVDYAADAGGEVAADTGDAAA